MREAAEIVRHADGWVIKLAIAGAATTPAAVCYKSECIKVDLDAATAAKLLAALQAGSKPDGPNFPQRQGATHGAWTDPTFTKNDDEIHSPRYFQRY